MPHAVHDWFDHMNIRNYGSTAMHLAMVAGGSVDAALGMECRLWDIAAGSLLVAEAGGVLTDLNGQSFFPVKTDSRARTPFLAAGPNLHKHLLSSWRER